MRKKLLLCMAVVGVCAQMFTGCVARINEEKLPDPKAEQNQEQIQSGGCDIESTTDVQNEKEATGTEDAGQEGKKPAKEWSPGFLLEVLL